MRLYGCFEAGLHEAYPNHELSIRNFGWPADEVGKRQRPNNYTKIDDPLQVFAPNVFLCFFGFNESFAGADGLADFEQAYHDYLAALRTQFASDGKQPRFVLFSPIAMEQRDSQYLPSAIQGNRQLSRYADAVRRVAEKEGVHFVDLYTPTRELFREQHDQPLTINGVHLNSRGYERLAKIILAQLGQDSGKAANTLSEGQRKKLREAIIDLQWHHQQDYRMVNGWYVYGGRSAPFDTKTFPPEYAKIRKMVADRDRVVWRLARGEAAPEPNDEIPELTDPPSAFGTQPSSEPKNLKILTPEEAEAAITPAPGHSVNTFADEVRFPELANPVQLNFDNRGRLWAACMPTYPQWRPGEAKPNDRLLIFEDTDGDGQADTVKVFADDLHCPTGFEFVDGGVLVVSQPKLLFLKDTNGDDRADVKEVILDGYATDDTHHAIGAFEWSPDGKLIMLEGISMSTTVETAWGPLRNANRSVAYALDPRSWRLSRHMSPCLVNPWCYTHNDWGQAFAGDGTGAQQHWATPLTGAEFPERTSNEQFLDYPGPPMRPALGNGFIYSRHFPDDAQGNFYYACVINLNGILQFQVEQHGSGYRGKRIVDLVKSSDRNFRPGDPQIGPDGALYFIDWHNPLIGHMQYSQRDPNRDHRHGRIYRVTVNHRPLVSPVLQFDKSIPQLLEQLREYEARTRYRVRRELRDRPTSEVVRAIEQWRQELDPSDASYERLMTEALWVLQGHHVADPALIQELLHADNPNARAAAVRALANQRTPVDDAQDLLAASIRDPHPRVRLETVRALSFFRNARAAQIALQVLDSPMDSQLNYTLESTLGALRPIWRAAELDGTEVAKPGTKAAKLLEKVRANSKLDQQVSRELQAIVDAAPGSGERARAISELARMKGNTITGEKVFAKNCHACHRVGDQGAAYAPNLSDVGLRLNRSETIESILFPNAKVEEKYKSTVLWLLSGKTETGLVVGENKTAISLLRNDGEIVEIPKEEIEERQIGASSMPAKLHEAMSGVEFIDLLEFLSAQKSPPNHSAGK